MKISPAGILASAISCFSCALSLSSAATAQAPAPAEPAPPGRELVMGESRLRLYGFIRLDAIADDSRPDSFQSPLFILSEDPLATPKDANNFTLHPRLSRLGLEFTGPVVEGLGGAQLTGRVEVDFQNGGRESRAVPRYRHVFLKLAWPNASLLAGQTSDILSPLIPAANNDTVMWNAGNLGDRRAQIRLAHEPLGDGVRVAWAAGLGLTGAVDSQDLDNDGIRDGEASGVPHVQARASLSGSLGSGGKRWELGVSGHAGHQETLRPIAGETEFESRSVALDLRLPLGPRLTLQAEAWQGENLSDVRGGIGQGVNTATGEEIEARGGWAELGLQATSLYAVYAGLTRDDPEDRDVPSRGRTRNGAWYLVNRLKLAKAFTVGLDYLKWTTDYKDLEKGEDNRFNLYLVYDF